MTIWILVALGVFLINIFLPALIYLPQIGVGGHVGPRDAAPEPAKYAARARRSLRNHQENLPIFLALALLAMITDGADMGQAILGAQMYVAGRLAYMPLYLFGVPWVRSAAYMVGLLGCVLIMLAIL